MEVKVRDIIIFSRFSSSRLPGKALKNLGNSTLLGVLIQKIQREPNFRIILATSNDSSDDILAKTAKDFGVECFRGSLINIAERTISCIKAFSIKNFARVNGDSPFIQTELLNEAFNILEHQKLDFVTNLYPRSFPYGVAVEVFDADFFCSHAAHFEAPYTEHITSFFYSNIVKFKFHNIFSGLTFDENTILTVDDFQTYRIVKRMFEINPAIQDMSIKEIISIYKLAINKTNND